MKHARVRQSYDTGGPSTQAILLTVAGVKVTLSIENARSIRDDLSEAIDFIESLNRPYDRPCSHPCDSTILDTNRRDRLFTAVQSHGFTFVRDNVGLNNEQIGKVLTRNSLDVQTVRRVAKWIDERLGDD